MKVFLQNRDFRQLTINQWISTVGDTIFYLAFLNYVADASFAPLAILLITISENPSSSSANLSGSFGGFSTSSCPKIYND